MARIEATAAAIAGANRTWDVVVAGGGNAGLCAALSARKSGASVLVLEASPRALRGGNSRHTRNLRAMHDRPIGELTDAYPEDEYWQDLLRVTGGQTTEHLARITIRRSQSAFEFARSNGVLFQPALGGTLHLSRTNAFFLGGGKALINAYYRAAERAGIAVIYAAEVTAFDIADGRCQGLSFNAEGQQHKVDLRALVVAAGGFEANLKWLKEAWGPPADNFLVRGTPYNTGTCLRALLDAGVKPIGDPTQGHMVAIDARAPKFDGGISTRTDSVTLGIVVNRNAERFYDEGEDFWPKRYAIWGRLVAGQPDQIAYSIVDSKAVGRFMPSTFPPIPARSLPELAAALQLDAGKLGATIEAFNRAVQPGTFDHMVLDDCHTSGLKPEKTHWARPIDTPPYYAYPVRPGITFTYLGVTVNEKAQMILSDGKPSRNMFAAGEVMAGNVLGKGYLAGIGMTIGTVFGCIAGEEAGRHVRN